MKYCAYLDIETTGLSPFTGKLTVIGLYIEEGNDNGIMQLVGDEISSSKLIQMMKNITMLYTYNGARFDLPFIKAKLNVDLTQYCRHKDLMYACWQRNLYGGLKGVERQLGIERKLPDVDGRIAIELWHNYKRYGHRDSLARLLKYNEEDVLNLREIRERLNI
ncbi:MAG TPA: exonuclease [Nitrospirae bacterium]|nr:hypothetical protein BMS3Abin06_00069 [bacterium BMS3Abin06]HDH11647.1 exonuclease [Nitrospirota bacterium]HDZ02067.1 exonuclease [Nitrospirota bacterium]